MAILSASKIAKSFGAEDIFWDTSVAIPHGARIALVGPNGAGKTTLIRILIGLDVPSAGDVHRARSLTIGYLPQEAEHAFDDEERTVWDEMLSAFAELRAQEQELRAMEAQMGAADVPAGLMGRYGAALEHFEHAGGYEYELRIRQVLEGLGFAAADSQMPIAHLSGGQKTRALLAKLLLRSPELLVLDEPTNHLDIQAIEWLEGQLINWPGSLLVVSHDRFFLDRVVDRVWELDFGGVETYRGNYSAYVRLRTERMERRRAEYGAQRAFIVKEEDFIRRHIAGQRTKEAQGRRKRLERLKRDALLARPVESGRLKLSFRAAQRSGDIILQTKDLMVGYKPAAPLFQADDIDFRRTECAALIGPNGAGKTTFLKTILGQMTPLAGKLRRGASLKVGYFAQAHNSLNLDAGRTVLEELLAHHPILTSQARNYLARFLFTDDDVFKPVSALSGGERGRLALALLMQQSANLLLMDEPTNHLDIPGQEVLESVLGAFEGTILLVSHDRYLVSRLATQIWALNGGRLAVFEGSYAGYLSAREREAALLAEATRAKRQTMRQERRLSPEGQQARKAARRAARQVDALEQTISQLEARLATLGAELEAAGVGRQLEQVRVLGPEYSAVEEELERRLAEWTEVAGAQDGTAGVEFFWSRAWA